MGGRIKTRFPHVVCAISQYLDLEENYVLIQKMRNLKKKHTKGTKHKKSEFWIHKSAKKF